MNALARKVGYRRAMEQVYGADSSMLHYAGDARRTKFLDLLDLDDTQDALEVGIGFGQHTVEIARRVRKLDALEVRLQNALFTEKRCLEAGLRNVTLACGGDNCLLPYVDNSFDVVIMNLVLEWAAGRTPNPSLGQQVLLREVCRVLKPNGLLQLNTKNRFALRLLLGKRDEHAHEIPFGHALPTFVMNLLLRLTGTPRGSGMLHSYRRMRRMVTEAGFSIQNSYWAVPEMRFPTDFVETSAREVRRFRQKSLPQGEYRSTRLLMPLIPASLVKHFTPGLFFLARKS